MSFPNFLAEVKTHTSVFAVCVCYRPPNNTTQFWEDLQESIDDVKQAGYETIIIAWEPNADPNTLKTQWSKLQYLCGSNYLKTCISEVARLSATSATTLDQIVISKNLPICNISISPPPFG